MHSHAQHDYLPAAGSDWALPFYDLVTTLLGANRARNELLALMDLKPGNRLLDIGCGTGTFAVQLKQGFPTVEITGLDPDPKALARAQRKASRSKLAVKFDLGYSDQLPYDARSLDHVSSSFMFHHLKREQKEPTLREVLRVLKPGGDLAFVDLAGPQPGAKQGLTPHVHSKEQMEDNREHRVIQLMRSAGFADAKLVKRGTFCFGLLHVIYCHAIAA
ncbi:MAG TPA: class I SAM-dependent methyltransferase [Candidatus Acidoferrales bacterium]|nr:class I SAM-dependent methyltransferase [Candidatus Acidoferrales bacterium]